MLGKITGSIVVVLLSVASVYAADTPSISGPNESKAETQSGVDLYRIIESVAAHSKMRFIVDPRTRANVYAPGLDLNKVTYRELQAILSVHGFVAVERNGIVEIVPDAMMRQLPLPVLGKGKTAGDDDYVVKVVGTGKLSATQLVPMLRPLLPQYAHLAAMSDVNSLVIVDHYGNIKKLEELIRLLEQDVSKGSVAGQSSESK